MQPFAKLCVLALVTGVIPVLPASAQTFPIKKTLVGNKGEHYYHFSFSPDGKTFAAGTVQGKGIQLWDLTNGDRTHFLKHLEEVHSVAISPDNTVVASGGERVVKVWNVKKGVLLQTLETNKSHSVRSLAFNPEGKVLALATAVEVQTWDLETGKLLRRRRILGAHKIAFRPGGQNLVVALGKEIELVDAKSLDTVRTFPDPGKGYVAVDVSPDGKLLVSGGYDDTVRLWDVENGKNTAVFKTRLDSAFFARFTPDGKSVVARGGFEVKVWDVIKGKEARRLELSTSSIGLAISPDGKHLALPHFIYGPGAHGVIHLRSLEAQP